MLEFYLTLYRSIVTIADLSSKPDRIEDLIWPVSQLLLGVLTIVCIAKIFAKAKRKPLTALIPFQAEITMAGLAELPKYWAVVLATPSLASVCIAVFGSTDPNGFQLLSLTALALMLVWIIRIGHRFGKETGFIIGLLLLGPIFWPILAFGDAEYKPTYKRGRSGEADCSA
jgi:hypothetical protein